MNCVEVIMIPGSLSMNIEAHNPYEAEKKSNHEALYRSRLLRTKKQKSVEGMSYNIPVTFIFSRFFIVCKLGTVNQDNTLIFNSV